VAAVLDLVLMELSPLSRRAYAVELGDWLAWCTAQGVDHLEAERRHVQAYVADIHRRRRDGTEDTDRRGRPVALARSTRQKRLSTIAVFYEEALEAGARTRPTNPARRIKLQKEDPWDTEPALTLEEVGQLLAAVEPGPRAGPAERLRAARDQLVLLLLLLTAIRAEEALSLTWGDLRTHRGYDVLSFRGKGAKNALAKVRPDLLDALHAWRETLRAAGIDPLPFDPIIVPVGRTWPPALERQAGVLPSLSYNALYRMVHQALASIGRGGRRSGPHLLRRTSVTVLYLETRDLVLAQQHARHASADTTQEHYVRPADALADTGIDHIPIRADRTIGGPTGG
jgi:integrase